MNTPAHLVANLAILSSRPLRDASARSGVERPGRWIAFGAVLPDAPMFAFFLWQVLVVGASQREIWDEAYFRESWQFFFDLFNSIPLAALALALALWRGLPRVALVSASVLLHCALDLPLHHDDAHAHFLPFTNWHFESPVSYWDPKHFGVVGAGLEALVVVVSSLSLWGRVDSRWSRGGLALVSALSVAGFGVYLLSGGPS